MADDTSVAPSKSFGSNEIQDSTAAGQVPGRRIAGTSGRAARGGITRRSAISRLAVLGAGTAAASTLVPACDDKGVKLMSDSVNPYGGRPGGGITLPEYYQPWPAIKNRNMFLPGTEILPRKRCG